MLPLDIKILAPFDNLPYFMKFIQAQVSRTATVFERARELIPNKALTF